MKFVMIGSMSCEFREAVFENETEISDFSPP